MRISDNFTYEGVNAEDEVVIFEDVTVDTDAFIGVDIGSEWDAVQYNHADGVVTFIKEDQPDLVFEVNYSFNPIPTV